MSKDFKEIARILTIFGIAPPKEYTPFNESEVMEVQQTIIELLEAYSRQNKEADIIGLFITLAEINVYLKLTIARHGGGEVFRDIGNAVTQSVLSQYKMKGNSKRIAVRNSKGQFIEYDLMSKHIPEIEVEEPEVDLKTMVDEILTKHTIFK